MKKFILSVVILAAICPVRAGKVDLERAAIAAQRHVEMRRGRTGARLTHVAPPARTRMQTNNISSQDTVFYYVFEEAAGGFVIVAGDDAARPVLGYAAVGSYDTDNLPPNFAFWMQEKQREIRYAMQQNLPKNPEWDYYEAGGNAPLRASSSASAAPLLQTKWDQTAPYWNLCPKDNGQPTYTGCVATAMAQIMKYYNYPARGRGESPAYNSGVIVPMVNYEINYDWENMLPSYRGGETPQQENAVATLMLHCGASVKMRYSTNESGAYLRDIPVALTTYFGYDRSIQIYDRLYYSSGSAVYNFDDANWEAMLRTQIDAGRPVMYSGSSVYSSHLFVCDGYDDNGMFHFNWGWGGNYDGYYATSVLNPLDDSYYGFGGSQQVIVNIKPDEGGDVLTYDVALGRFFASNLTSGIHDEPFTVAADVHNYSTIRFPGGDLGVALTDRNGQIITIIGNVACPVINTSFYIPCSVPRSITAGQYLLKAVIRPAGGEWQILPARFCPASINFTLLPAGAGVVTGVSLNKTTVALGVNSTEQLSATVAPADAANKTVTWSSSNTGVATVSDMGLVTAKGVGVALIAATAEEGGKAAYCTVTVSDGSECIVRASGTTGDLSWTLCNNGTLTISGTGIMNSAPWRTDSYMGYIQNVVIEYGVMNICDVAFSSCPALASVVIPNSVVHIGYSAFAACNSLTSVTIPNSVAIIGDSFFSNSGSFQNCRNLSSVTIGNSVTRIGNYIFSGCSSLTSVTIPNSVWDVGRNAFEGCSSLTSVTIPNSVTNIGPYAFSGCSSLTSVAIPNSVTNIDNNAFYRCSSLTSVAIGNSVTRFGNGVFLECSSLTSIDADADNAVYSSIDGVLFNKDKTTLLIYPPGKKGVYEIPAFVDYIPSGSFRGCTGLTSITIGTGVRKMDVNAFDGCTALTDVYFNASNCSDMYREAWLINGSHYYVFSGCRAVRRLTIGANVWRIPDDAFVGLVGLTEIINYATNPQSITSSVFLAINSIQGSVLNINKTTCVLRVPAASLDAYRTAPVWREFAIIEAIPGTTVTYAVTVSSDGAGATGSGDYEAGATVSISAGTSPDGQQFYIWTSAGVTFANANSATTTFVMPANPVTVRANFEQIPAIPPSPVVTEVTVTPATATVQRGGTQHFIARAIAANGASEVVTWSVAGNNSTATGFDDNATLTVAANETATTLIITATSVFDHTKQGTATVTVTSAEQPTVVAVAVAPNTAAVPKGGTQQFTSEVTATGGASQAVTWSVSGHTLTATGVSATGLLTVAPGETAKTLTVTAISVFDNTKQGTATVTIEQVGSVAVSGTVAGVPAGTEVQLYSAGISNTKSGVPGGYAYVASTATNAVGYYSFDNLPPGVYIVMVIMEGRESTPSNPMTLADGEKAGNVDFTVKGGTIAPDVKEITGTEDFFASNPEIYPNPFTDAVRITGAENCTLRVFNAAGMMVHIQIITNPDETISMGRFPAGVYFFSVENDGKTRTVRVVRN